MNANEDSRLPCAFSNIRFDRCPLGVAISQTWRPKGKLQELLPEESREVAFLSNADVEKLKRWLANDEP